MHQLLLGPSIMVRQLLRGLAASERRHDRGASLVEYALLIAFIAIVCAAGVASLGKATGSSFDSFSTSF